MQVHYMNYSRYSLSFKILSAFLAFTLLYLDVIWALDVRQKQIEDKFALQMLGQGRKIGTPIPNSLNTNFETQNQDVVDHQNDLLDLGTLNFSLTTQNGDILHYIGSRLEEVERQDGSTLTDIELDDAGNILNAQLVLSDGGVQIFQNGVIVAFDLPDGSRVEYEAGRIKKVTSLSGVETSYSYIEDGAGNISEIILENSTQKAFYDPTGMIKESISKADDSVTVFTDGIIEGITLSDGAKILFTRVTEGDSIKVSFSHLVDTEGNLHYYEEGSLTRIVRPDGQVLDDVVMAGASPGPK